MKVKVWLAGWFAIVLTALGFMGYKVCKVDPYFHYHKPDLAKYFYTLDNQRSQNDGITRHFDYDAVVTGTSMTQNFKATEADEIFGCNSIKVTYSGASYKEINDNLKRAFETHKDLKTVIRCLDMGLFLDQWDSMRLDLGEYPDYLYDDNPFNDVEYVLNRDVIFGRVYQMEQDRKSEGFVPGITPFDKYSWWMEKKTFGINTVSPKGLTVEKTAEDVHLTEEDRAMIKKNIELNVTSLADEHPDLDFYYFYSPYSVAWWCGIYNNGTIYKQLEAEQYITELIVPHQNIHLYSFNNRTDITTDLNHYKDPPHYASWINSLFLRWMRDGEYLLTEDNYKDCLQKEYDFYTTFDYESINGQVDYEADFYAAALMNKELTGVDPLDVLGSDMPGLAISGAEYTQQDGKITGLSCKGALSRGSKEDLASYLRDEEYIGARFTVDLDEGYNYLCFEGKKVKGQAAPTVYVYNEEGELVAKTAVGEADLDNETHQYALNMAELSGKVTVVMNGGCIDESGDADSEYLFTNVCLY